jgi:hypothetical protein
MIKISPRKKFLVTKPQMRPKFFKDCTATEAEVEEEGITK